MEWLSTPEIARLLGVTVSAVSSKAKRQGIQGRSDGYRTFYTPEQMAQIAQPAKAGHREKFVDGLYTLGQASTLLGASTQRLDYYVKRYCLGQSVDGTRMLTIDELEFIENRLQNRWSRG